MSASERPLVVDADALYPRDEENRYRIYLRQGEELKVIATAGDAEALGVALVTLHRDAAPGRIYDDGSVGILDCVAREWIVLPWQRRPHVGRLTHETKGGEPCQPPRLRSI